MHTKAKNGRALFRLYHGGSAGDWYFVVSGYVWDESGFEMDRGFFVIR